VDQNELMQLKKIAVQVREDCIKTQKIAGSGHLGGSFSAVELMVYLYFEQMNVDPQESLKADRDIFILSKGHASLGYYSVLARRGFFPVAELQTYRRIDSRLQGHSCLDSAPGIENSSGSLGQGFSFGLGIALGYRRRRMKNRVYVMIGDGELQEGQVWEGIILQQKLQLDNLILIVDNNHLQLDDYVQNVIGRENYLEQFQTFDFKVIPVDGHDFGRLEQAFGQICPSRANVLIADTVKGKGISFMENQIASHSQKLTDQQYQLALAELGKEEACL
jgi:transketolase